MLDRLPTLAEWERGGVAGLDQAGAMTATLANSTWGAVLDEQAIPGSAP